MQEQPRPNPPLDYRPHSEDARARRWPLWVGLTVAAALLAAAVVYAMAGHVRVTPGPPVGSPAPVLPSTPAPNAPSTRPTGEP